jgi:YD repeat-containing protein
MNNKQRIQRRRLIATILATVYILSDLGPIMIGLAAPQVFVHPGAGVSRLPLQVGQFNAAGFGDLNDAVNLANGSVYVGTDSVSYNSKLATGDESTNTVGGSGWNLTQRMRLNGFNKASNANFGLDNLAVEQNPASIYYTGWFNKPPVTTMYRMLKPAIDNGSAECAGTYASGVGHPEATPITAGTYRVSLEARVSTGTLGIGYGVNDSFSLSANLTTSWQSLSTDFVIPAGHAVLTNPGQNTRRFQVWENTNNNQAWEVGNVNMQRWNGTSWDANILTNQNLSDPVFYPRYCAQPPIETFYRMGSSDSPAASAYSSGLTRYIAAALGTYIVSFDARTKTGTLPIKYGVDDWYLAPATLNNQWQSLSSTFNVTTDHGRIFEVFEQIQNNPDWEIQNIKVQRITPGTFTLSQGDGSGITFTQQAITTPAQLAALNPPSWISRYSGAMADSAFYTINPVNGKQYSKEWIVLRRVGTNNMIAHYYDAQGNRTSFHNDGEYADYTQNSSQQYRGAILATPDPEGENASAPKTELKYWDYNSTTGLSSGGLLNQTKDEYGRINVYGWNATDKTLSAVYQLVQDEANPTTSWQRLTQFYYCTTSLLNVCPNTPQKLLTSRVESAYNGKTANAVIQRTTNFTYQQPTSSDPVLLRSVSRQILNGSSWKTTFYSYNTAYQVSEVKTVVGLNYGDPASEPATTYTYGSGSTVTLNNPNLPMVKLEPSHQGTVDLGMPVTTLGSSAVNAIKHLGRNDFKTLKTNSSDQSKAKINVVARPSDLKTRVASFTVPAGFAADLYRLQVQVQNTNKNKNQSTLLSFKTKGVVYQNGTTLEGTKQQTLNLGEQNLKAGQLLEVRANSGTAKFSKLTLIPLMVSAGAPTSSVKVTQGTGADRKSSAHYFDANGQLVRKEVRDYNAYYTDYNVGGSWSGPLDRNLIWYYDYNANGSTSSVISPSGRKDTMSYDANGNLTQSSTFLASTDATPIRYQTSTFDADNRMTNSTTPAMVGTGYNYSTVNKPITYTMTALVTPAGSGQTFTTLNTVKVENRVAGVLQSDNTITFDTSGRVTQTKRTAAGSSDQVTNIVYHTGTSYGLWYPSWTQGAAVSTNDLIKQYGDQPLNITKVGYSVGSAIYYDAFGHVILKNDVTALKSDIDNSNVQTPITSSSLKDRVFMTGFNGFGQKSFERLYEYGRVATEKNYDYYATGEINSSWDGYSTNVTDYRYQTTGADGGRLLGVIKGIGDGYAGSVTTQHESTIFAYDAFGRVSNKTIDGVNTTTYAYDTLDRVIRSQAQDGNVQMSAYSKAGTATFQCNSGGPENIAGIYFGNTRCQYMYVDNLGRTTQMIDETNHPVGNTNYIIQNTFDPFDRVLTSQNTALTSILTSSTARTTYVAYDSLGQVVKKLEPSLRYTTINLDDLRRPYSEYSYDKLGRKIKERKLLEGTLTPNDLTTAIGLGSSSTMFGVAVTADTIQAYDLWDRVATSTDPDGYTTEFQYDGLGNVTQKLQQMCKAADATCLNNFTDGDGVNDGKITVQYTYDAASRITKMSDGLGNISRSKFDTLGNVTHQRDARGITTKVFQYTADGLPTATLEPDNNTATPATAIDGGDLTGYVTTKTMSYGSRYYATQSCTIGINAVTAGTGINGCTNYTNDWAGRPTTTTFADGNTTVQTFDARGNLTSTKSPDGFTTTYEYDAWGKLRRENKLRRAGTIDMTALPNDLVTIYDYNRAGNLISKTERGLSTEYQYNSLGNAISETRPHTNAVIPNAKTRAYRLDGSQVAESTYDALSALFNTPSNFDYATGIPVAPSAGNITGYKLTPAGRRVQEWSVGTWSVSSAASTSGQEYVANTNFNGLGLKFKRTFSGHSTIYANVVKSSGVTLPPQYNTFWKYDGAGQLLKTYNATPDGSYLFDTFQYTYSPTGKERSRFGDVFIYSASTRDAGVSKLVAQTNSDGVTTSSTVTPRSATIFSYTEREQPLSVVVSDINLQGVLSRSRTAFEYYINGSRFKTTVDLVAVPGTHTYTYDSRERLVSTLDSNGNSGTTKTTNVTYGAGGVVTNSISDNSYSTTNYPTVGFRAAQVVSNQNSGLMGCTIASCTSNSILKYDVNGMLLNTTATINGTTSVSDFVYDNYGNQTSVYNTPSGGTRALVRSVAFNALNAIVSQTLANGAGSKMFIVNSRGMRTATTSTGTYNDPTSSLYVFANNSERYDANNRTAQLENPYFRAATGWTTGATLPNLWSKHGYYRRYDPYGSEVLSAATVFVEEGGTGSDGVVNATRLESKVKSTVSVDGELFFANNTYSNQGKQIVFDWANFWHSDVNTVQTRTLDETFSLADGALDANGAFDQFKPMLPYAVPGTNPANALQAPVTPTSTGLGILNASSVTAPNSSTPTTPPATGITPPGVVTPPATSATPSSSTAIVNTVNASADPASVSTPAFGVTNSNLTSSTPTTSSDTQTSTPTNAGFSSNTALQTPTSITAVPSISTASSVTPPNAASTPVGLPGDASAVTPPGSSAPTANVPSTSAVTPPPGAVAPPGTPGIGNAGTVTPPTGTAGTTVKPFREDPGPVLSCSEDPSQSKCPPAPNVQANDTNGSNAVNGATNTIDPNTSSSNNNVNKELAKTGDNTTITDPTNSSDPNDILGDPSSSNKTAENLNNGAITPEEVSDDLDQSKYGNTTSDTPCTCPTNPAEQPPSGGGAFGNTPNSGNLPSDSNPIGGGGLGNTPNDGILPGDDKPDLSGPADTSPAANQPPTFTPPQHTTTPCPPGVDCEQKPPKPAPKPTNPFDADCIKLEEEIRAKQREIDEIRGNYADKWRDTGLAIGAVLALDAVVAVNATTLAGAIILSPVLGTVVLIAGSVAIVTFAVIAAIDYSKSASRQTKELNSEISARRKWIEKNCP